MKITLICAGGISTSILVNKMKKAIEESEKYKNSGIIIEAHSKGNFVEQVKMSDIILVAPQIANSAIEFKAYCDSNNIEIPIITIDKEIYGNMDGVRAVVAALKAIKAYKEKNNGV